MDSLKFLRLYSQTVEGEPRIEYKPRNVAESNQWASNLRDEMVEWHDWYQEDLADMIRLYSLPCKDVSELPKFVEQLKAMKFVCSNKEFLAPIPMNATDFLNAYSPKKLTGLKEVKNSKAITLAQVLRDEITSKHDYGSNVQLMIPHYNLKCKDVTELPQLIMQMKVMVFN